MIALILMKKYSWIVVKGDLKIFSIKNKTHNRTAVCFILFYNKIKLRGAASCTKYFMHSGMGDFIDKAEICYIINA